MTSRSHKKVVFASARGRSGLEKVGIVTWHRYLVSHIGHKNTKVVNLRQKIVQLMAEQLRALYV